ncbi:hypothetical protein N7457_008352 [Penicillium paradoxum]|uniref:uncharacterized protein n=1 Tax=Penicillium paradoxum TaxID=176176 RepID=UPI0025496FE0|nr:uncharacterized protein N7457_008352 [Penicillium paradoxum]KAJ5773456.1 hypothetical protein N7457_008352 [Penicillium paradoxum]
MSDQPVFNPQTNRWDNVDVSKATGHKWPVKKVSYNRRDVLLFANAIGVQADERHFLSEQDPQFASFPTFVSTLLFKRTHHDVFDFVEEMGSDPIPGLPIFNPQKTMHGEERIEMLSPIPTSSVGLDLEIHRHVVGVHDKGGNLILESQQTLLDAKTGRVYCHITSDLFAVQQGGYGQSTAPPPIPVPDLPARTPDAIHWVQTTPTLALLYRLCGDYHPIHADDEFAKRSGYKGHILSGLGTWNIAAHGLLRELGGSNPQNFVRLQARFKEVVYPGDLLEMRMWKTGAKTDGVSEIVFEMLATSPGEKPRVVLNRGLAGIKIETTQSRL